MNILLEAYTYVGDGWDVVGGMLLPPPKKKSGKKYFFLPVIHNGNFYTKREGGFLTFKTKTGIPGGLVDYVR